MTAPTGEQARYTTFSVGPGLYRRYTLGSSRFVLEASVRYWPNVASSLPDGEYVFTRADGSSQPHRAHQLGLIGNLSVGIRIW